MAALARFDVDGVPHGFHDVRAAVGPAAFARMPFVARVLAENILRHGGEDAPDCLAALSSPAAPDSVVLPLRGPRVILPDSSGIPVLMDLAALRSALARRGLDPASVDSSAPISFIVDHSLQVDEAGTPEAEARNLAKEFERNAERYRFVKWAMSAFRGIEVFPPGSGIIHQIHLEKIARVTRLDTSGDLPVAFPDFAIGGDSHTPMVNALGVLAWGVGGLEAEMAALGEPFLLPNPEFVGVRLEGALREGVTITDAALTLTQILRAEKVVGAFVEFFGPGVAALGAPDRATLANMAPEYGASTGFWPVDEATLAYLRLTGRPESHVRLVEAHARAAGLFREAGAPEPDYHRVVRVDLSTIARSLAGPSKPHNRIAPAELAAAFRARAGGGPVADAPGEVPDGAIAIAAISSCTNTANPRAMIAAGLLARNAVARGLSAAPWVKTSLAPGSRAVTAWLETAGLLAPLQALGFHVIGYGCTTCGGKSGPLKPAVVEAIESRGISVAAVLSGNRNFDGRIHRLVAASFLASPALVVASALSGTTRIDVDAEPLGRDRAGEPVYLRELWPSDAEIDATVARAVTPAQFASAGQGASALWDAVPAPEGPLFEWDPDSTYIVEPPFFNPQDPAFATRDVIEGARALGVFEDGVTTDHISPGGEIPPESPAGRYLQELGVAPAAFNSYVGRRGNHHVLMRGAYANVRVKNRMASGREGWWTKLQPSGQIVPVFDAAHYYFETGTPLIVLGGRDFGSGSSRDWAAKGPMLLGVGAVLAKSFERIHRSNLIGVGIVPLLFPEGLGVDELGLDGGETFTLRGVAAALAAGGPVEIEIGTRAGETIVLEAAIDVRSPAEADLLRAGGVFQAAVRRFTERGREAPGVFVPI